MHLQDQIPIILCHLGKTDITENARVVYYNVHGAEMFQSGFHDCFTVLNGVIVGHRLATRSLDLFDHLIGRRRGPTTTRGTATQIIHHDTSAEATEQQSMRTPQTTASTGDDHDFSIET